MSIEAAPQAVQSPDSPQVRAFVAVELGDEARAAAWAETRALREAPGGDAVRWVRPESLHVTLRFLGDVPLERVGAPGRGLESPAGLPGIDEIYEGVAAEVAGEPSFSVRLGERMAFPSARRPRVIALDLVPHEPLEALAAAVERAVIALGFAPEERAFRPHLTLGRVRRDAKPEQARRLFEAGAAVSPGAGRVAGSPSAATPAASTPEPSSPGASVPVAEVVLFRSELDPGGARHTPLHRMALHPGDPARAGAGGSKEFAGLAGSPS